MVWDRLYRNCALCSIANALFVLSLDCSITGILGSIERTHRINLNPASESFFPFRKKRISEITPITLRPYRLMNFSAVS